MEGLITKFLNEKVIGSLLISVRVLSDIRTEMDHCSSVSIKTRSSVVFFFFFFSACGFYLQHGISSG